ncbi:MAG: Qat anti-phage system associated protein QatB [Pseudomonadota bacterium]
MGTSASSNGPGSGVPFDPPWLDDIAPPQPGDEVQPDDHGNGDPGDVDQEGGEPQQPPQPPAKPPELAPPARFRNARRELGDFARTGNQESFQKAVGHYSRTGMGGARNAANRMRASTRSAANLFGVLQSAREGADPAINEWVTSLTGRNASAQDVVDEIIRRVAPNGGSPDETSCRESMAQAMEDLLEEDPNVDLLHLEDDDIWMLIESFLGHEAFNRLCLDIGQVFENSALSPRDRVTRMNEMQDYLKAELCAQIEELRQTTPNAASNQLQVVLQSALQNTFLVYEGSL